MTFTEKGSSWHGSMLYSRKTTERIEKDFNSLPSCIAYFHHISAGDSKHDYLVVICYFEAVCLQIAMHFAHIQYLRVQPENANSYTNRSLILALYKLAQSYDFCIQSFVHIRLQDGKNS